MNIRGPRFLPVGFAGALLLGAVLALTPPPAAALDYAQSPALDGRVADGSLPPVEARLPSTPRVVDFAATGKSIGQYGGQMRMLMAKAKDSRQLTVYGYSRLIGYDPKTLDFVPDILERFEVEDGRIFTFHLREGHKWSDGKPFTAEDFRYWWEDMANNEELFPIGPPQALMVEGKPPVVEFPDATTVRYTWHKPNPDFLPDLARANPLYIYAPKHYLKKFHVKYADPAKLAEQVEKKKQRNWAALHNKRDNLYRMDNPSLPMLQPWIPTSDLTSTRLVFERNPYFHRVDPDGKQLPYVDQVIFDIASSGLIPAKVGTGEVDLQARYIRFDDYTFLRQGEDRFPYKTHLWRTAKGAHLALYPNLNVNDEGYRALFRDARFRRALSLAVNRHEINQVIYYGLALEGNNTVLPDSPLYKPAYKTSWATFDRKQANALLDEMGLTERDGRGVRLLPDGRPIEIIVESAGESTEESDVLALVHDGWMDVGVKLYTRPSQREVFRTRVFAGQTQMTIWYGLENGLATADTSPSELAPTTQALLQWPKWGQHFETRGEAGEPIDMAPAQELMDLYFQWRGATSTAERRRVWHRMLEINAEEVYTIGLISGTLQPVVVSGKLNNVPEKAIWNWDPGAHFGIYLPDTFWFSSDADKTASVK